MNFQIKFSLPPDIKLSQFPLRRPSCLLPHSIKLCFVVFSSFVLLPTPSFAHSIRNDFLEYYFREEAPSGVIIGNIIRDFRLDARYSPTVLVEFRFSLMTEPNFRRRYFSVDELTGDIRNEMPVDREDICPYLDDCVVKFDVAVRPIQFFQMIKIKIEILDVNDRVPVFPDGFVRHTMSELAEPGTGFLVPAADDPDCGSNAIQKYLLSSAASSSSEKFQLMSKQTADGSTDIRLVLRERLDRETEEHHLLVVLAVDGGNPPNTGSLLVNVSVQDANDNVPHFERELYEVTVVENTAPGTVVIEVKATDKDTGENAAVVYQFPRHTNQEYGHLFSIEAVSGLIRLRRTLDFEQASIYLLSLTANDLGVDALTGYASLIVRVQDVNDHSPQIVINTLNANSRYAQVKENTPAGTFVAHLSVVDEDSEDNGRFACFIDNTQFVLNDLYEGELKIATGAELDREQRDLYVVSVLCRDLARNPFTSIASLRIRILDENDNSPRFERDLYEIDVPENLVVGEFICQVTAVDPDDAQNGRVVYRLNEEAKEFVDLDRLSGRITSVASFDFEAVQQMEFLLTAADMGVPLRSATAVVRLNIQDIDDNQPVFSQDDYFFRVKENQPSGTQVGRVLARDADSASFGRILYRINHVRHQVFFQIDSTSGEIRTSSVLDREVQSIYQMVVCATSLYADDTPGQMTSSVAVSVLVDDVNDHRPVFTFPTEQNETVFLSKEFPKGHLVVSLRATDRDLGPNSRLTFALVASSRPNAFAVNASTGDVTVNDDLTDVAVETIVLKLVVADGGTPPLMERSTLHVVVTDLDLFRSGHGVLETHEARVVLVTTLVALVLLISLSLVACFFRGALLKLSAPTKPLHFKNTPGTSDIDEKDPRSDAAHLQQQQPMVITREKIKTLSTNDIYVAKATAIVNAYVTNDAHDRTQRHDLWQPVKMSRFEGSRGNIQL